MAFNVRAFGYRGMRQLSHLANRQFTSDTVYALEEPYEWAQIFSINGDVMTPAFASIANDLAVILRIEVADGSAVRYEINPPGRVTVAGNNSPKLSGVDVFPWGPGWSLSMVDAASHL